MTGRSFPVSFENADGLRLAGIIEEPAGSVTRTQAVILLSPGVKTRVAPHRLYGKLARVLTERGFRVLRFDFYGLGDSEGTVDETLKRGLYASIQVGRYVADTRAAMDWMQKTYGASQFVLGGLCGGAITAILAAPDDSRVEGILALGLPVTLDSPDTDSTRFMTVGQLKGVRSRYLRKVLDPRAWLRLLTLKTDFVLLLKALMVSSAKARGPVQTPGQRPPVDNANPLLLPAFIKALEGGCRIQLVFSEVDRLTSEFEEKFSQRHEEQLSRLASGFDVRVITSANHVLTLSEWQDEWFGLATEWCHRHFPDSRP
jgi:alpha/beta superfamily hydrolase